MNYLAFDLGAESGRAVLGRLEKNRLTLEILHRFPNRSVLLPDGLHWDTLYLFSEIKAGLSLYRQKYGRELAGVSCDSWGVDFGLLDKNDVLLSNPWHYRDHRTDGIMEKVFKKIPPEEIYRLTGIQFMPFNTIYQMYAMVLSGSPFFSVSQTCLMTADLFHFFLSGEKAQEYTLATTSQLLHPGTGQWAKTIFDKLSLPVQIMPSVTSSGTVIGGLREKLAEEFGLGRVPVIAGASHDTAAAVAGCPVQKGERSAYLSSGTWSLLGVELEKPLINEAAGKAGFTNEGGVAGTIRFLKNVAGLWLLQECRRKWLKEGEKLDYADLAQMAESAPPFLAVIDPDDPSFLAPDDMTVAIVRFCERTGQKPPAAKGEFVRVILESLALRYHQVIQNINRLFPGKGEVETIRIVGGGSQNQLLNQFTADATGLAVVAGPVEATAAGNIITQALATGEIASVAEGREIIRNSFPLITYQPKNRDAWQEAAGRL
jgi:rhamnulokinase